VIVHADAQRRPPAGPALYFHHSSSLEHDPRAHSPGHPDTPERLLSIESTLAERDWAGWERRQSPALDEARLELVHTPGHVSRIRNLSSIGGGAVDPDTFVGEPSYRAALHAAGGACEMTRTLLTGEARLGFSAARPSGHHAEAGRAMGFCLFNNVAVAAELAIRELGARRVFILDWDVHHGNGTAEIFRYRPDVLFASIHQEGIYPGSGPLSDSGTGRGEGYTLNLPVPAGAGEELWLSLLAHVVLPAARAFEPELVLLSAGFDAHRRDPLAGCSLESTSFAEMARHLLAVALERQAPLGGVLEGGYDPQALAESLLDTLLALGSAEPPRAAAVPETQLSRYAAARLGRYWPL
jgi:acetoin utilization deacetylase AcuC-like enzyme